MSMDVKDTLDTLSYPCLFTILFSSSTEPCLPYNSSQKGRLDFGFVGLPSKRLNRRVCTVLI